MQDRYAGDVGDFGKIGLLQKISESGLSIGVNWYLTYKPEEHNKADGKHIGYLTNSQFKDCDDKLLKSLYTITNGTRSVEALEKANLIPNANYYNKLLKPGNDKNFDRLEWFRSSLEELSESDIIFCDPDNGLIVKSVSQKSVNSDKYILHDELVSYYQVGKSIIFYNHRCREKENVYLQRFQPLMQRSELMGAEWRGLKYVRGTIRDYIFILQDKHTAAVDIVIKNMMKTNWNKHFSVLNI
ncbi:hypothetical protein [Tissierella sp.]|uniref:hypothetical protein n=1 Tax=Tissierella sp. TaxID=41274 RepID=UPI002861F93F|nr:hypothetical protein [Tissierella sp.]MDR7855742.1 hypothetical protein [Tissierella sp.]